MKNSKRLILYIFTGITALVFLLSPLLLRITLVKNVVSWILQPLNLSEYKNSYISLVSSFLGSFLAVTGALWTQKIISESDEKTENEKIASVLYFDLKGATDSIVNIIQAVYPICKDNLSRDEAYVQRFRREKRVHRFTIDNNWKKDLLELRKEIEDDNIAMLLQLYSRISMIERVVSTPVPSSSTKEDKSAYMVMLDMVDIHEKEDGYSITLKQEYQKLLTTINSITKKP